MGTQLWNRELRSVEERLKILSKSNRRCARCGKELCADTMTLDHFIPFSKGGPDTFENLVALCEECNYQKQDIIVNASDYYKFLPKEECRKLMALQESYSDKVRWWNPKNFTKEDSIVINYSSISNVFMGHKNKAYCTGIPMKAVMKKCVYADLDEVLEFSRKYHEKNMLPTDDLKEIITDLFQKGAIYKVEKGGNIVGLIPVCIDVVKHSGGKKEYVFSVHGLPVVYQKQENADLMIKAIRLIMQDIALIHPQKAVMLLIGVVSSDEFGNSIARNFSSDFDDDDGFNVYSVMSIFETEEERKIRLSGDEASRSFFDKISEGYSDFICETFKIRSADKFGKAKKIEKPKKKEKRRREFDEYDIEYYKMG